MAQGTGQAPINVTELLDKSQTLNIEVNTILNTIDASLSKVLDFTIDASITANNDYLNRLLKVKDLAESLLSQYKELGTVSPKFDNFITQLAGDQSELAISATSNMTNMKTKIQDIVSKKQTVINKRNELDTEIERVQAIIGSESANDKPVVTEARLFILKDSLRDLFDAIYGKGTFDDSLFIKSVKNSNMLGADIKQLIPDYKQIPERTELYSAILELWKEAGVVNKSQDGGTSAVPDSNAPGATTTGTGTGAIPDSNAPLGPDDIAKISETIKQHIDTALTALRKSPIEIDTAIKEVKNALKNIPDKAHDSSAIKQSEQNLDVITNSLESSIRTLDSNNTDKLNVVYKVLNTALSILAAEKLKTSNAQAAQEAQAAEEKAAKDAEAARVAQAAKDAEAARVAQAAALAQNNHSTQPTSDFEKLLRIAIINKFVLDKLNNSTFKQIPGRDKLISVHQFINNQILDTFTQKQEGGNMSVIGSAIRDYFKEFRKQRQIYNENSTAKFIMSSNELLNAKPQSSTKAQKTITTDASPIPLAISMPAKFMQLYTKRQKIPLQFQIKDIDSLYFLYHGDREQFTNKFGDLKIDTVFASIKDQLENKDYKNSLTDDNAMIYFYIKNQAKGLIIEQIEAAINAEIQKYTSNDQITAKVLFQARPPEQATQAEQATKAVEAINVDQMVSNVTSQANFRNIVDEKSTCPKINTDCAPCTTSAVMASIGDTSSKFLKYEMKADVLKEMIKMIDNHKQKIEMMERSTLIPEMRTKMQVIQTKMQANKPSDEKTVSDRHVKAVKRGFNDMLSCIKDTGKRYYNINFEFLMDLRKRVKYMQWWEEEMNRRIAMEKAFVELGDKVKQSGGSLTNRYKPLFDDIAIIKKKLLETGAFCIDFYSKQIRSAMSDGLKSVAGELSNLPEEEDRNHFVQKREAILKYVDQLERKIFSMYSIKYSIMDIILDKRFLGIYVFKLISYGILVGSIFFAEKIFSEMYMKKVYAENSDAPSLLTMFGIFLGLFVGFNLFLLTIMFLMMYIFKTPSNDFLISGDFIQRFVIDLGIYMVLLSLVAIVIGSILEKKRYFRYKTEGLRCIRAFREILIGIAAIMVIIPYFSIV